MKTTIILFCFLFFELNARAQQKEVLSNGMVVFKDFRMNAIAQREFNINTSILKYKAQFVEGYRLMVLNTRDKSRAFQVRSLLLKNFPEQKPYMWYANPYIRLKFGNFPTQEEAEVYQKKISKLLDGATIYLLNETIEVNPGKDFDPESMRDATLAGLN